jgi:hypothetical protein
MRLTRVRVKKNLWAFSKPLENKKGAASERDALHAM